MRVVFYTLLFRVEKMDIGCAELARRINPGLWKQV